MNEICQEVSEVIHYIPRVTIETNATIMPTKFDLNSSTTELHLSMSPKLYHVSGEVDAVKLKVIERYLHLADSAALKFVLNDRQEAWDELDSYLPILKEMIKEVNCGIWIMPVGSDTESQDPRYLSQIAKKALLRGLNISARVQIYLFGNLIGT
jgi:hypothetical protein